MIGVDKFPEFKLNGVSGYTHGDDADHDFITLNSWELSGWSVIYFYPKRLYIHLSYRNCRHGHFTARN